MNTKYNELEEVYEVDLKNTSGAELLAIETPNKYVTYAGLERAVRNVLSKAKDYDKGLAGGYNGTFPLTAATKGNIYLLPATKKYYICIKDYSGSQLSAPNSNFEELSVYANRSKLDNLSRKSVSFGVGTEKEFNISKLNIKNGIYLISSLDIDGDTNAPVTIGLLRYHTINSYSLFVPITSSNENVYGYIDTTDGVILKFNNSSSILNRNYTIWIDCIS